MCTTCSNHATDHAFARSGSMLVIAYEAAVIDLDTLSIVSTL